jgi:hypothetical protein
MARTRKPRPKHKSRPKGKTARASRAPSKRARKAAPASHKVSSKAASRPKLIKSPPEIDPLDDFIAAAARVLALPIEPQWLAAIKANLEVNLRLGALVAEFALPDESEPAPVFTA